MDSASFKDIFESHYTWIEGFGRNVRRFGAKKAMIDPVSGKEWTYASLDAESQALAGALLRDGAPRGSVVMLQLLNCPEFVFAYVASQKIGGICCPVNYRLSPGELAWNLSDSKPFAFIFSASVAASVEAALAISAHRPEKLICVGGEGFEGCITFSDYVRDPAPVPEIAHNIYDETTRLYTSGTTGRPKAVPLTSINEVLSAHDVMIHFPMGHRDVTMNTTPWFHRGGLHCAGPCPALYAGATIVVMDKFEPKTALEYVAAYGITFLVGVPTVLEALSDEQERLAADLSSLRGIVTMGSPLERSACIRYQKVLTPNIFNGYGTTETFWNTFLRPFDLPEYAGSAGMSCIDDDVRVVKVFEDRLAEPGELAAMDGTEVGEVIISSPAKSPYIYWNNPEETAGKYHHGFIYTHDLATWDSRGFVTIIGRKDDMIISSGENIYPTEVEAVLNQHPKVADCMVTSVPDKTRGQIVTAYIVRAAEDLTPGELDAWCKSSHEIANFKRPRFYRFVSSIPISATGKKLHVRMKEIARDDHKNGLLFQV